MYRRTLFTAFHWLGLRNQLFIANNYPQKCSYHRMVKTITVDGYAAFKEALNKNKGTIYVLFSGSPDENGVSWCPDCVKADPVIHRNMDKIPADAILIHCRVGDRTYWKNQNNEFRKDTKLGLKCVPTLLKIGSPQKLEEEQCLKDDLVQMMFEDDD